MTIAWTYDVFIFARWHHLYKSHVFSLITNQRCKDGRGGDWVTLSWAVEANMGIRARVRAAGKALEWDDRQTPRRFVHYMIIVRLVKIVVVFVHFFNF